MLNYLLEVSALLANRVAADAMMAVVEVAVEHITGAPTDTILAVVGPSTIVIAALVPEVNLAEDAKLLA